MSKHELSVTRIESVAQHPWAAIAVGAWVLAIVGVVLSALKECVAILATGKRRPEPDWRALSRAQSAFERPRQRRRRSSGGDESSRDGS